MSIGPTERSFKVSWYPPGEATRSGKQFVEGLTPECWNKYRKLRTQLQNRGAGLAKTPMFAHLSGDVWELRDLCDAGALRIYLFRRGVNFFLVCGELKSGQSKANRFLIAKTQKACDAYRESQGNDH